MVRPRKIYTDQLTQITICFIKISPFLMGSLFTITIQVLDYGRPPVCCGRLMYWVQGASGHRLAHEDLVSLTLHNIRNTVVYTWSMGQRYYQQIAKSTPEGLYSRSSCAVSVSWGGVWVLLGRVPAHPARVLGVRAGLVEDVARKSALEWRSEGIVRAKSRIFCVRPLKADGHLIAHSPIHSWSLIFHKSVIPFSQFFILLILYPKYVTIRGLLCIILGNVLWILF